MEKILGMHTVQREVAKEVRRYARWSLADRTVLKSSWFFADMHICVVVNFQPVVICLTLG